VLRGLSPSIDVIYTIMREWERYQKVFFGTPLNEETSCILFSFLTLKTCYTFAKKHILTIKTLNSSV
jgi:hypothetical protein